MFYFGINLTDVGACDTKGNKYKAPYKPNGQNQ